MQSIGTRTIVLQIILLLVTLAIMDAALYFLLPHTMARNLIGYRSRQLPETLGSQILGRAKYPHDYFVPHQERGFDIGAGRSGFHYVEHFSYPVWANSFGCFDREWTPPDTNYVYFAGDSFTWGYAPYDDRFVNVFERLSGIPSLKCGVSHTGQLHQFSKFKEITAAIGLWRVNLGRTAHCLARTAPES